MSVHLCIVRPDTFIPLNIKLTILLTVLLVVGCSNNQSKETPRIVFPVNVTADTKSPLSDLAKAVDAGKPLYAAHCALCHGEDGKTAEGSLGAPPTDLTAENVITAPDGKLFLAIKNGVRKNGKQTMPPAKEVTDEQIWQMVAYIRKLNSE